MNDATSPAPPSPPTDEQQDVHDHAPPVLDYAPVPKRSLPQWLTRPLTPGRAVAVWIVSSIALRFVDVRIFYPHLAIGIALCAIPKVIGWQVGLVWKLQALLALGMLAIVIELFVAPWRAWGYSLDYWILYNQTYIGNHDASLRVAWVAPVALAWLALTATAAKITKPSPAHSSTPPLPPPAQP